MELHQLRYFVASAEAGSISRAASRMGVAQPSVSQQLAKLEREVGTRLFDRVGRGVMLTEAGEALLPRARTILAEVRAVTEGMGDLVESGVGRLAVGAIPTIAPYLVPGAVQSVREGFPDASVVIREDLTGALLEALADNEIDIAVVSRPAEHELVELETVGTEPLLGAVPSAHPLARAKSVGVTSLRTEPAVALDEAHCLGQQIEGFCASKRIARQIVCETTQLATVLEFVRAGMGIAVVPRMAARAETHEGVEFLPLSQRDASREIVLARRIGRTRSRLSESFAGAVRLAVRRSAT